VVEVLTVQEVAEILKLHPRTVMKMAAAGEIPAAKVGKKWRFDRRLVEDWFSTRIGASWLDSVVEGVELLRPSEYLRPDYIRIEAEVEPGSVLGSLASLLNGADVGVSRSELVTLLREREAMFPTATEAGVAFPHPRHPLPGLREPVVRVSIVPKGVSFGAPMEKVTYIFVMLCSPNDRVHLHLLAHLARVFRQNGVVESLRKCSTSEEAIRIIQKAETTALADNHK
jgi:nitrogen PTS system EIIA component